MDTEPPLTVAEQNSLKWQQVVRRLHQNPCGCRNCRWIKEILITVQKVDE